MRMCSDSTIFDAGSFEANNPRVAAAAFLISMLLSDRESYSKRTVIASVNGYVIRFLGTTFNQTDLDLWEMLLHLGRLQPLGSKVEFTERDLLVELDRSHGGDNREQLKEQIARLIGGVVEVQWVSEKKTFAESLVSSYAHDEKTGKYSVTFSEKMSTLYESDYTLTDLMQRRALGKNNLAKWLHGHYASHAQPFPYKTQTLYDLCGSTTIRLVDFRKKLRVALARLVKVGALKSWSIDKRTDLVSVVNLPSKTQIKHTKKPKSNPPAPVV